MPARRSRSDLGRRMPDARACSGSPPRARRPPRSTYRVLASSPRTRPAGCGSPAISPGTWMRQAPSGASRSAPRRRPRTWRSRPTEARGLRPGTCLLARASPAGVVSSPAPVPAIRTRVRLRGRDVAGARAWLVHTAPGERSGPCDPHAAARPPPHRQVDHQPARAAARRRHRGARARARLDRARRASIARAKLSVSTIPRRPKGGSRAAARPACAGAPATRAEWRAASVSRSPCRSKRPTARAIPVYKTYGLRVRR